MGQPAVQAESVTVVTDGGNLVSYSMGGKRLWNFSVRDKLSPFLSRSPEGASYICGTTGVLIAVNRVGRELWRVQLRRAISSPVLIGWDGRLFVHTGDTLECFTASGHLLWRRELKASPVLAPVMNRRGGLILIMEQGELLEIDAFGGVNARKLTTLPVLVQALDGDEILLFSEDGVGKISRTAGEIPFLSLGAAPLGAASRGNRVAVALRNGQALLLDTAGKKILWKRASHLSGEAARTAGEVRLIYNDKGIFSLSQSGASSFDEEGRQRWMLQLPGAAAIPALGEEGILYAGGGDGTLYAFRLEKQGESYKSSPSGGASPGSYGTADPRVSLWKEPLYMDADEAGLLLGQIGKAVQEGQIGARELEYTAYLMEIAERASTAPEQIRRRVEALRLLGVIGSGETIPFLAHLYVQDETALIKAAAAEAIGSIGVDPGGTAMSAFNALVQPPVFYQNQIVLAATAQAVGALCRSGGPPVGGGGIRLLTFLTAEFQPGSIRRIARRELTGLTARGR